MQLFVRSVILSTVILLSISCLGQVDRSYIADSISNEGKRLYESEMTSWYGTDVFLEKFKEESENIGGYFSYKDGESFKCLFFSKGDKPNVLGVITFIGSFDPKMAQSDGTKREFTEKEKDYYTIRNAALNEIKSDTSLFKRYKNTEINLIPLIDKDEKKVYVLTATSQSGIVIIGNDYLLLFTKTNELLSKRKIHANLITLPTKLEEKTADGNTTVGSVHNHLPETGELMTATDVCTFMLYERFSNWKQQIVISQKYMSIWNCGSNKLIIVPTGR